MPAKAAKKKLYDSDDEEEELEEDDYDRPHAASSSGDKKRKPLRDPRGASAAKRPKLFESIHKWADKQAKPDGPWTKYDAGKWIDKFKYKYGDDKSFKSLIELDKDGANRDNTITQMEKEVDPAIGGVASRIIEKAKEKYADGSGFMPAVRQLIRSLLKDADENNVIPLNAKGRVYFKRCLGQRGLYVRECYKRLLKELDLLMQSRQEEQEEEEEEELEGVYVLVSGTPGIGKSACLFYLMSEYLKAGYIVAFDSANYHFIAQIEDGKLHVKELTEQESVKVVPDIRLMDSYELSADPPVKRMCLCCGSPGSAESSLKHYRGTCAGKEYYLPVWSWEELEEAIEGLGLKVTDDMKKVYSIWSGVPRHVLVMTSKEAKEKVQVDLNGRAP